MGSTSSTEYHAWLTLKLTLKAAMKHLIAYSIITRKLVQAVRKWSMTNEAMIIKSGKILVDYSIQHTLEQNL